MGIRDPRIVDAAGRVRNLDREAVDVIIAEFIARGLISRHRAGAISFGDVWACWFPVSTKIVEESGVCYLTLQAPGEAILEQIEAQLISNKVLCERLETYLETPVEFVYYVKLCPVGVEP